MQKIRVALLMIGMCASSFFVKVVKGAEGSKISVSNLYIAQKADGIYGRIDFGNEEPLSKDVFRSAYTGFLNLKTAGKVGQQSSIITICDFSLSSNVKRLWVIDMDNSKILFHSLVAHGQGTGDEFARNFSNKENSHQSSMGFYVTDETYTGDNGYSLKLKGMDAGYNDAAYDRSIVMHGADYVCESFIKCNQRLGRSWGCPAIPREISAKVINTIKDGSVLYIYYPNQNYLAKSVWLNKASQISEQDMLHQQLMVANAKQNTATGNNVSQAVKSTTDSNTYQGVTLSVGTQQ
ncbi:murein L,D-transpeptidase catalytic domain family protein [Taibaiella lutea]|uniref:Murein L,D-transpeptidase catalytic domain family protein n=1 Tax=Taibaiella lutea TaxID=2608001 RepID=A0A5M6CBE8_9BACT|nr:murein L,D-transpeptidase catalytic domain family protein [Taibaiella lutea]KAA5532464.1 murein L,D-transpeptidase catalytic domain family protein [Taibaiella lutea]